MKICLFLIAAFITISTGCKKDKNKKPVCRISKLTNTAGKEIKITYNAEADYAKIENSETGETRMASYSPGSIVYAITNSNTGTLLRKITIALNGSEMASLLKTEIYDPSGTRTSLQTTICEYNGMELVKTTSTISGRSAPIYDIYNWTNGNMTSVHNDNYDGIYEYFPDKAIQQGDWLTFLNLIGSGFDFTTIIKNKNLIKKYDDIVLTYGFDAEGKINALYQNGSLVYTIEYECR